MRISVIVDFPGIDSRREVYRKEMQVSGYEEAEEAVRHAAGDIRAKGVWEKKEQEETK